MNARPVRVLTLYFVAWKLLLLLVVFCAPGPGYDTSTTLLGLEHVPTNTSNEKGNIAGIPEPRAIFPLLLQKLVRWDAIYFVKIAERGYLFEQEWAFGYGRVLGIVSSLGWFAAPTILVPTRKLTTYQAVHLVSLGSAGRESHSRTFVIIYQS
jgi:hypothetical protein